MIILFGGESKERLVSVATAQNMSAALSEALCWFWAPDDAVYQVTRAELAAHQDPFQTEFKPTGQPLAKHIQDVLDLPVAKEHVFVLGTHGGRGEDGTLQGWLEKRGIAHTGPDSKACHIAMDKAAAKKVLAERHIRVVESFLMHAKDFQGARDAFHKALKTYPKLILKPNSEGSSVGLMLVTEENREAALKEVHDHPGRVYLLEPFIEGIELTVGVVDGPGGPRALVPTEMRGQGGPADYNGKYLGHGLSEITPAEVPESVAQAAQRLALAAHESLGCEGYSRTDMMVDDRGPIFLETNTLPGMTKASLIPQALAYEGTSVRTFLLGQVEIARERLNRHL